MVNTSSKLHLRYFLTEILRIIRNRNQIKSELGKETKKDISIFVWVIEQNTFQSFACICETQFNKQFVQSQKC